nr:reverse transcriptase domain-containing protein [Tanacetum cinerariifolium]
MVPDEEDRVERFIRGLLDNIQGNVIATNPARLQDAIRIANQLMDKKLHGYAARSAENKRRMESNLRDNRLCTIRCGNCKKVGHQTRDCRVTVNPNSQGAAVGNPQGIVCYECGRPGHFKKNYPKLRNQNRINQTSNKIRNKARGNEVTATAYTISGGGTNPDSNVVMGNVIATNPARLQDAIRITIQLIDKKLQGYATRSAENKRRMESNPKDNRGQQPPFKRQNTIGQNDCPKLRNQNHGNQTRNKTGNKNRGNEVIAKDYAISGGGTNPDSNVVTGTFLLNNCYASMSFDSGADRSFVLTTFSALLDVAPSTLDT